MHPNAKPTLARLTDAPGTSAATLERRQLLLGGLALVGSTGCGYILHPERRGRSGGTIDGTVLIFDLLWLLPGLLPGVVALAVDFTGGGIYGSPTSIEGPKISKAGDGRGARVEVALDGVLLASAVVASDRAARLVWGGAVDEARLHAHGVVRVRGLDGQVAEAAARELFEATRAKGSTG